MTRWLKEPLLHFALIGALIFGVSAWRTPRTESAASGDNDIAVTAGVVERLRAGYERQFGQAPDETELRGLVTAYLREEVLYREAMAMGLDRDDTIVRRRMAQKMEFLTNDITSAEPPDETALQDYLAKNAPRYAKPAQVSFRHVYLSREKRGAKAEADAGEALASLTRGASDETMGDAFLHGFEFAKQDPNEIGALFGKDFAEKITTQSVGVWQGPVASSYGLHLVRVDRKSEPKGVTLSEVRDAVMRDWSDEKRRQANDAFLEGLRSRYVITIDEAALISATENVQTAQP